MKNQLTLWSEEALVKVSPLPEIGKVLKTIEASSCSLMEIWSAILGRAGLFGKMSPEFYPIMKEKILNNSYPCWMNTGMVWRGVSLTLNTSEYPSAAAVSSLSDILETSDIPHRYYLTSRAAKGILRRAERKGGASPGIERDVRNSIYNSHPSDSRIKKSDGLIDTVTGRWGSGGNNTPIVLMDQSGSVMNIENDITGTLRASEHQHNPIIFKKDSNKKYSKSDLATTLLSGFHDPSILNLAIVKNIVRRITPREAERLQGFPDDWTKIPYKNKDIENCPDGPRYKAIGNSMAVPVMRWIGERILLTENIFNEGAKND